MTEIKALVERWRQHAQNLRDIRCRLSNERAKSVASGEIQALAHCADELEAEAAPLVPREEAPLDASAARDGPSR